MSLFKMQNFYLIWVTNHEQLINNVAKQQAPRSSMWSRDYTAAVLETFVDSNLAGYHSH